MKKLYKVLSLLLFSATTNVPAQLPVVPAVQPGTNYPVSTVPYLVNNASAYSCGNLSIGGNTTDLFVYTWDVYGLGPTAIGSGLAVRQSIPPAQSNNPVGFPQDASSVEAVILRASSNIYILCTYYWIGQQGFYLDLYQYQGGGVLQQLSGYPLNITAYGATAPASWIHLDVHNLDQFIITWQENGRVLAKAGTINSGFNLGETAIIDNSSIALGAAAQPDVALIRSQQSAGQIMAHFVYTNQARNRLVASTVSFTSVLNTPSPLASIVPAFDDDQQNPNWVLYNPRIDAPDDYVYDDWSYVVKLDNSSTSQELIFTGVQNNALGTLFHFNLNDGSLGALPDISPGPLPNDHMNKPPVLAYADDGENIYYCWGYLSGSLPPTSLSERGYIGIKISNKGLPTNPNDYWLVQTDPQYMSKEPAIALSGGNVPGLGLFMAYAQLNPVTGVDMTTKTIPWTQTSFRPGKETKVLDLDNSRNISVSPNPFMRSFRLESNSKHNDSYRVRLNDVTGRTVLSLSGNLQQINRDIEKAGIAKLAPGIYFLQIKINGASEAVDFKLLKIQ